MDVSLCRKWIVEFIGAFLLAYTAVAETVPEQLHAAVYLCAYMLPPGMSTNTIRQDPSMNGSLVPTLLKANPKEVGAMRIDWRSEDSDYREQLRLVFASDVSPADFADQLIHRHCDEPVRPFLTRSVMTAERFGRIPRHYFRTLEDRTIPIAAQDVMISAVEYKRRVPARKRRMKIKALGCSFCESRQRTAGSFKRTAESFKTPKGDNC
jgi:hypothetical protein